MGRCLVVHTKTKQSEITFAATRGTATQRDAHRQEGWGKGGGGAHTHTQQNKEGPTKMS